MQVTDQKIMLAGAGIGVASFATGTAVGIRGAGQRYAEAERHVRSFARENDGPRNAADAKRMVRAASRAATSSESVIDLSKPFNLNAPGMRSADAIATGAKRGALAGVAILAGAYLATRLTND